MKTMIIIELQHVENFVEKLFKTFVFCRKLNINKNIVENS